MLVTHSRKTRPVAHAAQTARRGFTLGELVVSLLLFSIVGGSILALVMRQQRFYRSTAEVMKVQSNLRQGASLLPIDLRGVSTSDTLVNAATYKYNADIYTKNDWHVEFRRTFGSSLICAKRSAAPLDTITLYPKATNAIAALSSWGIAPAPGDSILVLDDWTMVGPGDDRWIAYEVKGITPVTGNRGCPWKVAADPLVVGSQPDSTSLLFAADTVRQSFKIALSADLSKTVIVGAPVRFFRRVRYEIYQAPDQLWYLGYSDCLPTYTSWNQCSEVTPVAGPYSPYTGMASENGLTLVYFDSLGNKLATTAEPRRIARVEVVMRGATAGPVTRTGAGSGQTFSDSVVLSIGIRNRR